MSRTVFPIYQRWSEVVSLSRLTYQEMLCACVNRNIRRRSVLCSMKRVKYVQLEGCSKNCMANGLKPSQVSDIPYADT